MASFLYVEDEETTRKINIDELYEKNQNRDLKQISIFNKILNRIHKRIQFTSKNKIKDKYIWFNIPEYIFGEPCYSKSDCIGYLVVKLEDNGFQVRFIYPSTLFVGWNNWIPSYIRNEVKKKTGMVIDERGNVISKNDNTNDDPNSKIFNDSKLGENSKKDQKQYTPIDLYKPTGSLIYNQEMFEKLEKKIMRTGEN
jgi:hypothetical protein